MPTGQKAVRQRLIRAKDRAAETDRQLAIAAAEAKAAGVPVRELAELLGYKTRRSVYQLLERHDQT